MNKEFDTTDIWQNDFDWLEIRHKLKEQLDLEKLPDLQSILFLIGVQELGQIKEDFTKEEKQDLMHIATCKLLSYEDFYSFQGLDADSWPHWELTKPIPFKDLKEQEYYLQKMATRYINENL